MELNFLFKNERLIGARSSTNNISAGVGGVIAGAGSVVNGLFGAASQAIANNQNASLTRQQMNWQARQNDIDRVWNSHESALARSAQRSLQQSQFEHEQDMWNRDTQYNSPSAQMARYQMAGINPFVAMSGNQPAIASSSNVPSVPSVPQAGGMSSHGAASPIPMQPVNPANGILQGISTISGALDTLASAKKKGVETTQLEKTMTDTMRKLAADADSSEYFAIINQANASVAKEKAQKEMQELTEKIKLLREQIFNAGEEGKLITEKALRETEERYLAIAKRNLAQGEYDLVKKNLAVFDERVKVELDEIRSRTNKNNEEATDLRETRSARISSFKASARYQNASAAEREMLNEITDIDVETIKKNGLTYVESIKNKINYSNYFNKNQKDLFDSQLDLLKKQIEIAKKTGDWYGVSILLGGVKDLATAGAILAK